MDPIAVYIRELRTSTPPRFTKEEEAALARKMHRAKARSICKSRSVAEQSAANQEYLHLRETLVRSVLPYALKMTGKVIGYGVDQEDLIQLANMGVLRAVDLFDPSKGRLTTYATWHVKQRMSRMLRRNASCVSIPEYGLRLEEGDPRRNKAYAARLVASLDDLAGCSVDGIRFGIGRGDASHCNDDGGMGNISPANQIPERAGRLDYREGYRRDERDDTPMFDDEQRDSFWRAVESLPTERFRNFMHMRAEGKFLSECGEALGVTRERARQIQIWCMAWIAEVLKEKDAVGQQARAELMMEDFGKRGGDRVWKRRKVEKKVKVEEKEIAGSESEAGAEAECSMELEEAAA